MGVKFSDARTALEGEYPAANEYEPGPGDHGDSWAQAVLRSLGDGFQGALTDLQGQIDSIEAEGAPGADGIACWDLDGDGINDVEEDVNEDSVFDANDCTGADGVDGVDGINGANGTDGFFFFPCASRSGHTTGPVAARV